MMLTTAIVPASYAFAEEDLVLSVPGNEQVMDKTDEESVLDIQDKCYDVAIYTLAMIDKKPEFKGIVRLSRDRKKGIVRAEKTEKGSREGVSAVYEIMANECRFCAENTAPNAVKNLASAVVVAVARCRAEASVADSLLSESVKHAAGADIRNAVDLGKDFRQRRLRLTGEGKCFIRKSHFVPLFTIL